MPSACSQSMAIYKEFFLSYHLFHTVESPLMDGPQEKNFILEKNIASEGSCDMLGHNTQTTTSNFLTKLALTGLKGVTPYNSQLQTAIKPWFQMQSIAFTIIFFVKWCYTEILLKGLLCTSLISLRVRVSFAHSVFV